MTELAELAAGRTCLYVAHRLSTVKGCDRIVVLSEGLVVEEGSHEQLLSRGGLYAQMWARQVDEAGADDDDDGVAGLKMGRTPAPEEEEDGDAAAAAPEEAEAAALPAVMMRAE